MPNIQVDFSSIKAISLPEGWREFAIPDQGFAMYSIRQFRPADSDNDDVSLCLFNRGLLQSEESGHAFIVVLEAKVHHLLPREIQLLSEVLNEVADAARFSILDARTELIDGQTALIVEGRWISSHTKMIRAYFHAKEDGRSIDECFFSAPPDRYESLIKEIRKHLSALKRKST